jgi:hypothetical protein
MELNTLQTNVSTQSMSSGTFAEQSVSAQAPRAQTKVFPEHSFTNGSAITPHERSAIGDQTYSREKRGDAPGTSAKPEFRENAGGKALNDDASSHVKFDQNDYPETRGNKGQGMSNGIVLDAMSRIDQSTGAVKKDLTSAVTSMKSEISASHAGASNDALNRIASAQNNPTNTDFTNYRSKGSEFWPPHSLMPDYDTKDSFMRNVDTMSNLPEGSLAYVSVGGTGHDSAAYGHSLLVQRLTNAPGGSERYAIFDPNNGVFTYDGSKDMEYALSRYMSSAFKDNGLSGVESRAIQFFVPSSPSAVLPESRSHVDQRVIQTNVEPLETKASR